MPKAGFTSLTIGDVVYDKWHDFFEKRKNNFKLMGISSVSGLISAVLDAVMKVNGTRLTEIIQTEVDSDG